MSIFLKSNLQKIKENGKKDFYGNNFDFISTEFD